MKDAEVYGYDVHGSTRTLRFNPDGALLTALDETDVTVTASITSTQVVGPVASDVADTGNAPVKEGGIARTANPTPVANGDVVSATYDDVGRKVVWPYQVRDLVQTAYATLSNGTETTLLTGAASTLHDLVEISLANTSSVAVQVDVRSATAAGIVKTFEVPPTTTVGATYTLPIPQDIAADTWTADMPDITGTTVLVAATFIKNV